MAGPTPVFSQCFTDGIQRFYHANKGDVTFVCGPLERNVHSLLLESRSKVFESMLNGPFQEGISKRIELKQQDPHLVTRMLEHLYGFDYSGDKICVADIEESSHVSELHTHVQMYALGDEYDMKDLKDEALWKFKKAMEAKKGQDDELECLIEVIPTIYSTTLESDRGLRDLVVTWGASSLDQMKDMPEFRSAATEVPLYTIEVLPEFLKRVEDRQKSNRTCTSCKNEQLRCGWCGR